MKILTNSNNSQFVIILLFSFIFYSSCTNKLHHYSSNDATTLSLRKKNDIHISGSTYSLNPPADKNSQNIQAGYSPFNHVGIAANYYQFKDIDPRNSIQFANGRFKEVALGSYYFHPLSTNQLEEQKDSMSSIKKGVLFDLYFGFGKGNGDNFFENNGTSFFQFKKMQTQLGIHLITKNFGLSYFFKRTRINFNKAKLFGYIPSERLTSYRELSENNKFTSTENTFKFFINGPRLQIFTSVLIIESSQKFRKFGHPQSNINFGITADIDEIFRSWKKR